MEKSGKDLQHEIGVLKIRLELIRNQQSVVFEEIKLHKELLSKLTKENKDVQDKIQKIVRTKCLNGF